MHFQNIGLTKTNASSFLDQFSFQTILQSINQSNSMDAENDFEFEIVNADDDGGFTPNNTIADSVEDLMHNNKEAIMADKKISEVEMVEDDSTLNNSITTSCESLDVTIEDLRNKKKTLASAIDLVSSLIREVECKGKDVEQAKAQADKSGSKDLAKAEELKQAQQCAKETNDKHAKEVYAQKGVLATEMNLLQFRVSEVLNKGGKSVGVLDEMCEALEKRLTTALREKDLADEEKLEKELSAQKVLAYEESQMKKVVEESDRLKQEAVKNSKLQEFLNDRGHAVDMLDGDISNKCRDVNSLKEMLDQAVLLSEVLSSSQMLSIMASSGSSSTTKNPKKIYEQPDSRIDFDINASTDDNALQKEIETSSIIAPIASSLTSEIPNERNEAADSHMVPPKPFVFGPHASSTNDHVQTQIKCGNSENKNRGSAAGVKNAGYHKMRQTASTKGRVASAQNFSNGRFTFLTTIRGYTYKG